MHDNADTSEVAGLFSKGELDRRGAVRKLLSLGLSGPAAYSLLGVAMPEQADAAELSNAQIEGLVLELTRIVHSPEVIEAMKQVKLFKGFDASTVMAKLLEVSKRPEFKVANRSSMRASLRVFEHDDATGQDRALLKANVAAGVKVVYDPLNQSKSIQDIIDTSGSHIFGGEKWVKAGSGTLCASFGIGLCVSYGDNV